MMQTIFPSLYENSFDQTCPFWQLNIEFNATAFGFAVYDHLQTELEQTAGNLPLMVTRTTAFINDAMAHKTTHPQNALSADYFQFMAAGSLLTFLARDKYFPMCFDWILNSLADEVSTDIKRDFDMGRLDFFIVSHDPFIIQTREEIIGWWLHDVFYYSLHSGGVKEIGEFCITKVLPWVCGRAILTHETPFVLALCQMSSWCINYGFKVQNRVIQQVLQRIYDTSRDRAVKKATAFHFSCLPVNETEIPRDNWTQRVLDDYADLLVPHERFQITVNQWEDNLQAIEQNFDTLLNEIRNYKAQQQPFNGLLFNHIESTIFTLLTRTLVTLVTNGRVAMANKIFAVYFSVPEEQLLAPNNLYIVPGYDQGVLFATEGSIWVFPGDANALVSEVTDLRNAFLGTTIARNDDIDSRPEAPANPERQGVANRNAAAPFENCLRNLLHLNHEALWSLNGQYNGYYLWFGIQLPVQCIISTAIGITIPLVHSFQEPLPTRPIRKIFVWKGFTQMADFERMGLEEIFAGCEVVNCDCFESDKQTFLTHYADPIYDLIWILGHGEFPHHSAHESYLDLGNGINVSTEELKAIPLTHENRRLLLIDACDGASSSLANNPASIGIGVSVVGRSQSIMSHNWPVENVPSLVMGLLVGSYLAEEASYEESHRQAVVKFREGKEAVLLYLREMITKEDVLERIENNEIDYQNFVYWGSLSFII